jgi:RNA polymerase sigma factor (sigma-70 family)
MNAEELFEDHVHLAKVTVHRMFANPVKFAESKHLEIEDLYQYARLGLWDACKTWQDKPIGSFKGYAIRNMRWSIGKFIPREQLNQSYYRYYQKKDDRNKSISLISMSHQPFGEEDDSTLYEVIANNDESVESQVVSELENNELFNILKPHEKEMVQMKLKGMIEKEIATYYGVSRQCINMKFKQIQKKINKYRGVTV